MKNDIVLKEISKILIPTIKLFSIYVILHGHLSAGGGFAGGTILGCSYILSHFAFGKEYMKRKISFSYLLKVMSICLIIYGTIKGYSFFTAGTHMPHPPLGIPGNILSSGFILPLNILVGIIVACVIYIMFEFFYEGDLI